MISIVIPVRNEQSYIAATIEMLLRQDYPVDCMEIIVADGMSSDETAAIVGSFTRSGHPVRLIDNPRRLASAGRNVGIKAARGEIVTIIDGHCEIRDPQYLRHLVSAFEQSDADCVGRPQPLDVRHATFLQRSVAIARSSRLGHHPDSFIYSNDDQFVPAESVGAAYHRSVFDRVGYFDESFDACEDVDFNHRVDRAGLRCFLATKTAVHYHPRRTLRELFRQMMRYGRGRVRFCRKHGRRFQFKSMAPVILVLLMLASLTLGLATASFEDSYAGLPWWPLFVPLGYVALVSAYSVALARCYRDVRLAMVLPAVFVAIHIGAGVGILVELLSTGRKDR